VAGHFYAGAVTDISPTPSRVDDEASAVAGDAVTHGPMPGSGLESATVMIDEAEVLLGDVEAALDRLESGQYRTCEICGAPLEAATLASTPTLRRCLAHDS
jgi:hypothetical protein